MALTDAQRAVIQAWNGVVRDELEAERLVDQFGNAYVAALQMLMTTRAGMVASPARVGMDGDAVDHSANIKYLGEQITSLAQAIRSNTTLALNGEAEELLGAAGASAEQFTESVPTTVRNRRRGG